MSATVSLARADGLAELALSRPAASNALDRALKEELLAAVGELASDPTVRAVLLRAEGKNFCVGQDLAEHSAALDADPSTAMSTVGAHYNPLIAAVSALEVPVVVAIQGGCVGAGLGLALAGDIRIAGAGAKFATAFTGIALASDSGLSYSLVRSLGLSRATGLMLLGDRLTAAQAGELGLVHRVVDDAELESAARDLAQQLASGPTAAYREVKRLLAAQAPLAETLERERVAQEFLGAGADHRAAVTAFLTKSTPVFTGH
ncbi:enoyl-CoA hydratase [Nocardia panacis]|uniref:Enoyl-CoA hydratase n=1 Tax=Nocardia panacis TaxID=2340916 RepID=A0A3A4K1G3_9NOCA|nr:enoyl-CoA hydratase-related protein [Nocardia panacis]RJO73560.1 enoyl-CoA hydratase [Nocardia panacis]